MKRKINLPAKFSLKKLLYNKRFTIPLSLITAFALWLVIMIKQNPDIDRTFTDIPININLENTFASENGMEIIGDISSQKFTVTIKGPSYVVSALQSGDFYVYASAAAINAPGEYQLEVSGGKNTAVSDYEFISISPSTVNVDFDYVDTKEFTVKARAEGASATEGLIAETAVVSGTESDTITIKGPRTVINRIATVEAYAAVNKTLSESTTYDAEIRLYDEQGAAIDMTNLTLSENAVKVTVPISKRTTVPVVADFTNLPDGFQKSSIAYSIDHQTVTVIGTPEAIDKITKVTLSAIDITSVSVTSNKFDVSPKLPDGVRLFDSIEHFTVTVNTSGYDEKTFTVSSVRYKGLSAGLNATSDTVIRNVRICGPKNVIAKLKDNMLYALVDLSDKAAGEHTVSALIRSDSYNNVWQVGSYSAMVKIR